jgi:hypothetical protein
MKNKILLLLVSILLLGGTIAFADKVNEPGKETQPKIKPAETVIERSETKQKNPEQKIKINTAEYAGASSLDIVAYPRKYLGKKVKIKSTFDKFSTLGLDYKPAFRDSQKYISFLIKRDDVKDHTIPLSEMKIFILRTEAEKFIDLDSGDVVEIYGKVFSDALGDSWVDVDQLVVLEKKTKIEKS